MEQLIKAQQVFELQYPSYIASHKNYERPEVKEVLQFMFVETYKLVPMFMNIQCEKYVMNGNAKEYFSIAFKNFQFVLFNVQFLKDFQLDYFVSEIKKLTACCQNLGILYEPTKHIMQDALRIDHSDFQFNLNF
jgi:hypothetical protein